MGMGSGIAKAGAFVGRWTRRNYEQGRMLSTHLTRKMSPGKAKFWATAMDVAGVGILGGFFGLSTLASLTQAGSGLLGIASNVLAGAALPALGLVIPTALALGFGVMGLTMTAMGVGMYYSIKDRFGFPRPKRVRTPKPPKPPKDNNGGRLSRPFKALGRGLRHPFNKEARRQMKNGGNQPPKNGPAGPRSFDL